MKNDSMRPGWLLINAFYVLAVLLAAFVVSECIGTVFGLLLRSDTIASTGGDLTRNYFLVYPLYGLVTAIAFFLCLYFCNRLHGYRIAFSRRETVSKGAFLIETLLALAVYEGVVLLVWWDVLPSWFFAGSLAAVCRLFDASNVYNTVFEGQAEITNIALYYYLWIQILLELLSAAVSFFVLYKGRRAGETSAQREHDRQLAEMRREAGLE